VPELEDSGQLVSVTANAAERVRELLSLEADPSQSALRLAVRFKVENPNASSTCRCGESFELAEEQTGLSGGSA
jgi:Fe-S cluster assembly iron-binding protein IscA